MTDDDREFDPPQDVIEATTTCKYQFSCLKSGNCGKHPMCEVDEAVGINALYLVANGRQQCHHQLSFGTKQLCMCPTRSWIYRNHAQ